MKSSEKSSSIGKKTAGVLSAIALAVTLGACSAESPATFAERPHASVLVGLGGSVEAGVAAGAHVSGLPESCGQTMGASLEVVAHAVGATAENFACSGATTANVIKGSESGRQPAQLQLAKQAMRGATVYYLGGGNNVGWMQYQAACLRKGCEDASAEGFSGANIKKLRKDTEIIVDTAYSDGARKVVVLGYYGLGENLDCVPTPHHVSSYDKDQMSRKLWRINHALAAAAHEAGAEFMPTEGALVEHELCSADPWIYGLRADEPLHPNPEGQKYGLAPLEMEAAQA